MVYLEEDVCVLPDHEIPDTEHVLNHGPHDCENSQGASLDP